MPEPPSIIPSINDRLTKIQNESQLLKIVSVMLSAKVYKKISWNSMLLHFRNELAMKVRKIKGYKARNFQQATKFPQNGNITSTKRQQNFHKNSSRQQQPTVV